MERTSHSGIPDVGEMAEGSVPPALTDETLVPAARFDELVARLDVADDAPRLRDAARANRLFERS